MRNPPIPGCRWVADNLLVRTGKAVRLTLPQALLEPAVTAGVACAVNLVSKQEFLDARSGVPFDHGADMPSARSRRPRSSYPTVFMSYVFWTEADLLPTARQVRQALGFIEDAHAVGLRVLVNGIGNPARATLVAGCWWGREGRSGDGDGVQRLGWLEPAHGTSDKLGPSLTLSAGERALVAAWPTGREGQPELADLEWTERDEVFPFAPVEHWLRILPTVRVYPGTRGRVLPLDVPVLGGQRVSDGADIDLDVEELRRGIWIGERTLRLSNGWQMVFVSPF